MWGSGWAPTGSSSGRRRTRPCRSIRPSGSRPWRSGSEIPLLHRGPEQGEQLRLPVRLVVVRLADVHVPGGADGLDSERDRLSHVLAERVANPAVRPAVDVPGHLPGHVEPGRELADPDRPVRVVVEVPADIRVANHGGGETPRPEYRLPPPPHPVPTP